jgi:PAS domain S-box-containing protein
MKRAELDERLREQRDHLGPLLEISPSATIITDLDSKVVAWNPAAEHLFGYTADEALGHNLDDLVAKTEELHEAAVSFSERTIGKDHVQAITRRTRKDGTLVDVELRAAPVLVDGEPVGTFGIYHDISELQRQKQYYEALLAVSPAAIVAIDPRDNVTLWNPAAEWLFGYTAEEARGRNIDDLVASNEEIRREAVTLNREAEAGPVRGTTRRTRKDGSLVDVELLGAPISVGGEPVGRYAIYLDVSELQRRRRYYESLVELSPTAIITIDPQENVTSWNPAAERLFGYSAEETIGRNIDDLVANRDDIRDEAVEISRRIAQEEVRLITRRTRKDGSLVDVEVTGAPIYMGGELVGMYGLFHDVSELQEQRRYLQAIVQLSPTAIVVTDHEARVTSWNPAAERLFGYTADEAIGRNLDDLVATREDLHAEGARYSRAALKGERVRAFARRTRKDGSLVDVELISEPIVVGEESLGFLVIYHDVTELQQQKRYFQSLLEISPTAIVVTDLESKVVSWNPAAERLFGYSADDAVGRLLDDLVAARPELHDEAVAYSQASARGDRIQAIARRTRKDGSLVDVQLDSAPVNVAGERVGFVATYHDIGEIQRQRRYYEALVQSSPVAIALLDLEGNVAQWNPAAEQLFGYTAAEASGRHIDDLVTNAELRAEADDINRRADREGAVKAVTRRAHRGGHLVDVEIQAVSVLVEGVRTGLVAIYHDVTELLQARREADAARRQAENANEAKSRFLSNVSHELRTPLTSVLGFAKVIGKRLDEVILPAVDTSDPKRARAARQVRDNLSIIVTEGERLTAMINNVLDLAKIESGRFDWKDEEISIAQLVQHAGNATASLFAGKGLELRVVVDDDLPVVRGDSDQLLQVVINLLSNAVKFTDTGRVAVRAARDDGVIRVSVSDTGVGIAPEDHDKVFEQFRQVGDTLTDKPRGTGLGLPISKEIVEHHGGRLWFESAPGQGSTFYFSLPIKTETRQAAG